MKDDDEDVDALTGCADDQIWADVPIDALRKAADAMTDDLEALIADTTPPPWEARPAMARPAFVLGAGEVGFSIFEQFDRAPPFEQVVANARLAAAAPDLARECIALRQQVETLTNERDEARAALKGSSK